MTGRILAAVATVVLATVALTAQARGGGGADPALEKLARQFEAAFNQKDATAVAALYTDAAVLMPPSVPFIRGRADIEAFYRKEFEQGITDLHLTTIGSSTSGQVGFDAGTSDVQIRAAGCPARDGSSWSRRSRSAAARSPCTTGARADAAQVPPLARGSGPRSR